MSSKCSIGLVDGYHFYYDVNDWAPGDDAGNYWVWISTPDYESFRVMPLRVWEKMTKEDCNGYIKELVSP